jgi:hypothetical protein
VALFAGILHVRRVDGDSTLFFLGALSIESYSRTSAMPFLLSTLVIAAVSVVLPWST